MILERTRANDKLFIIGECYLKIENKISSRVTWKLQEPFLNNNVSGRDVLKSDFVFRGELFLGNNGLISGTETKLAKITDRDFSLDQGQYWMYF